MKTARPISALFVLFACTAAAQDPKSEKSRDPWHGFAIGSWTIESETIDKDGEISTQREKLTRTANKDSKRIQLTGRKEGKTPGTFNGAESTQWHVPGVDPAQVSTSKLLEKTKQDLTIEGKKYACDVKKYEMNQGNEKTVITYWHCKDVSIPYRELGVEPASFAMGADVLRLDVDYKGKDREEKVSVRVVGFRDERKIGKRKAVCVREEGKLDAVQGDVKGKGTVIRWLSDEVPGREVASSAEGEFGGKKFKKSKQIEDFDALKEK